mmetsp:Transcript_14644/g.20339  ORF Transcript_14644/g.20339 Transcript_14644/m.20339 type:complete len:120 (-) Transcript_14644:378-737(-)
MALRLRGGGSRVLSTSVSVMFNRDRCCALWNILRWLVPTLLRECFVSCDLVLGNSELGLPRRLIKNPAAVAPPPPLLGGDDDSDDDDDNIGGTAARIKLGLYVRILCVNGTIFLVGVMS